MNEHDEANQQWWHHFDESMRRHAEDLAELKEIRNDLQTSIRHRRSDPFGIEGAEGDHGKRQ